MKCEICSKLIIEAPEIVLVSIMSALNVFDTLSIFVNLENVYAGWNTLMS